jgi:putative restriction endonuclease
MPPSETAFLEKLANVKRWARGEERAPHKPLLLLMALARAQRGEERLVPFTEIEYDLRSLLETYGPSRKSYHPEFPFWYLQSDDLWEIPGRDLLKPKKGGSSPSVGTLRDNDAEGGLPDEYFNLLKGKPDLIAKAAETILNAHFPPSMHDDLLAAVGLTLEVAGGEVRIDAMDETRVHVAEDL